MKESTDIIEEKKQQRNTLHDHAVKDCKRKEYKDDKNKREKYSINI